MTDVDHITGLQVTGVSQLTKEIQETRALKNKKIDTQALFRNEETGEQDEGHDQLDLGPDLLEVLENDSVTRHPTGGFVDKKAKAINEIFYQNFESKELV